MGFFKNRGIKMNKKIPIVIALMAVFALSSISLAFAQTSTVSPSAAASNLSSALASRSYVRINGIITQWGTTAVNGALQTQAGASARVDLSTNQIAMATAIWTTNTSRPI